MWIETLDNKIINSEYIRYFEIVDRTIWANVGEDFDVVVGKFSSRENARIVFNDILLSMRLNQKFYSAKGDK